MRFGKWTVQCTAVVRGALPWCPVWGQEPASKPLAGLISELSGRASIRPTADAGGGSAQRFDAIVVGATHSKSGRNRVP